MSVDHLVGVPYVVDGRSVEGADCWGLVVLYFRDVLGVELPSYATAGAMTDQDRYAVGAMVAGELDRAWSPIEHPRAGDLVLIRRGAAASHVGVYLDGGRLLHSPGPHPSVIDRLRAPHVARAVVGYFRHEALS